jgi:hypothetical protein
MSNNSSSSRPTTPVTPANQMIREPWSAFQAWEDERANPPPQRQETDQEMDGLIVELRQDLTRLRLEQAESRADIGRNSLGLSDGEESPFTVEIREIEEILAEHSTPSWLPAGSPEFVRPEESPENPFAASPLLGLGRAHAPLTAKWPPETPPHLEVPRVGPAISPATHLSDNGTTLQGRQNPHWSNNTRPLSYESMFALLSTSNPSELTTNQTSQGTPTRHRPRAPGSPTPLPHSRPQHRHTIFNASGTGPTRGWALVDQVIGELEAVKARLGKSSLLESPAYPSPQLHSPTPRRPQRNISILLGSQDIPPHPQRRSPEPSASATAPSSYDRLERSQNVAPLTQEIGLSTAINPPGRSQIGFATSLHVPLSRDTHDATTSRQGFLGAPTVVLPHGTSVADPLRILVHPKETSDSQKREITENTESESCRPSPQKGNSEFSEG